MKVFTCYHNPQYLNERVYVVVAETEGEAHKMVDAALIEKGLRNDAYDSYTLSELDTDTPSALIFNTGHR